MRVQTSDRISLPPLQGFSFDFTIGILLHEKKIVPEERTTMSVEERINRSLKTMSSDELVLVYDQIQLIQILKKTPHSKAPKVSAALPP
jgi:hypothetical protein